MFLDEYNETPYETLRYTCGECNYGGKVTDGHDRNTVECILRLFYTPAIETDESYRFSPSGNYRAPEHGTYDSYLVSISKLQIPLRTTLYVKQSDSPPHQSLIQVALQH